MKYLEISRLFKIILFFLLSTSFASIKTEQFHLSEFEYSEIMKNPDASYVCFDSSLSDIKQVIFKLSKLDKDKTSPLHAFKRFLRKGYIIGLYDEVIHVLEYAEFIVKKKTIEAGKDKIKFISKKLKDIIQKVLNNELYFDVKNIVQQKNIKDFIIDENNIIQKSPIIFNETIAAKDNLIVRKNVRIHGTLKQYAKALFKEKVKFEKTIIAKKDIEVRNSIFANSLSVSDAIISGNLIVENLNTNFTSASINSLTAFDAIITNLEIINCIDDLCVENISINSFNTAGVVHNDAIGNLSTSLIVDADIENGIITNNKLANISSNDIPNTIVLRDGFGNFVANMISINGTVTNATDVATKEYVDNASVGLEPKIPARVVAITNKVLSGLQTIDSISLVVNDRVLLVGQSFPIQNGLWLAQVGAWTRPFDFPSGAKAGQAYVLITSGAVNAGSSWLCNTPEAIIDTDSIFFVQFSLPDSTTGANVGAGTGLIFRDKTGNILNFKSLIAGNNITIANNVSDITLGVNSTSLNTPNTIVLRDASGNFSAGTITANLIGNATSTTNFSGSLVGDVTGTQGATVVSFVGGQSAANVSSGTILANAATSANTANTIVRRNASGNFSAGTITANLIGNATSATNFTGPLAGDVTGIQGATVVSFVGGQSAANVASGTILANAATSANTANTIVRRNAFGNFSAGTITANLVGNATSATNFTGPLAGDVTGTQGATVVSFVGGQSAADVAFGTILANAATSTNTPNTIVRRNGSGNFSAGTITATLNGVANSAVNFTGALSGDVTGTQNATVISFVAGQIAANVSAATALANAATSSNSANTIVRRDGSGNFSAGTITASLNGNATGFTGSLAGDVTGTQGATVVNFVGGQSAANIASAVTLTNSATSSNTPNTLVLRNISGNFSAGTITATLNGNASTATTAVSATNFTGALAGDVTGTQGATVVSFIGGQSAANVASATMLANAATNLNTPNTIVLRDGSGNFFAGTINADLNGTATNFSGGLVGDVTGTQGATIVSFVGGQSAANVAAATVLANAATSFNTPTAIVRRDGSGNFIAGLITTATGVIFPNGGSTLDYYFAGSATPTFNANTGTPLTLSPNVLYTRIGNIVTVTIQSQTFTATGSPQVYTASAVIPAGLVPTQGQVQTVISPKIGASLYESGSMGTVVINSSGDIIIRKESEGNSGAWLNASDQGWDSVTVTYCV